ncbi:MAG: phosphatidate cytidylyltransferase [Gammaproteobacteria bacterium]|nr:phosphatidate cytidylyltransferase [Gammaproteobacteria bacterium]NNC76870.1 phosphatidate cytidylyltransferase [Woeseiaceae bacterium]
MLKQRIVTAIIALTALALVLFVLPPLAAELVIAVVVLAGAWEWSGFLGSEKMLTRVTYVILVAAVMAIVGMFWPDGVRHVLQVALVWWFVALIWAFFFPTGIPIVVRWSCGFLVLIPMYIALVMLYQANPSLLLFSLLIVWAADIGAYFAGKQFGRVKLAPEISPGKTWEGVIGGMLLVAALTVGRSVWFETDLAVLLPFCLGVAGISIVGDLTVSMFKRSAGVKDSGKLFPGHGGVLDRVDSIAAATPVFALGLGWTGLV